jgi:GNAT superfamily N-acetyltransferase
MEEFQREGFETCFVKRGNITKEDIPDYAVLDRVFASVEKYGNKYTGYFFYKDGTQVGYCFMSQIKESLYCMEYLEIREEYQRKGLGKEILLEMKRRYPEFLIEPVGNGSYHFYFSNGAKPFASHGSGMLLIITPRSPLTVREEWDNFEFSSYVPSEDFVYSREEWNCYEEVC